MCMTVPKSNPENSLPTYIPCMVVSKENLDKPRKDLELVFAIFPISHCPKDRFLTGDEAA